MTEISLREIAAPVFASLFPDDNEIISSLTLDSSTFDLQNPDDLSNLKDQLIQEGEISRLLKQDPSAAEKLGKVLRQWNKDPEEIHTVAAILAASGAADAFIESGYTSVLAFAVTASMICGGLEEQKMIPPIKALDALEQILGIPNVVYSVAGFGSFSLLPSILGSLSPENDQENRIARLILNAEPVIDHVMDFYLYTPSQNYASTDKFRLKFGLRSKTGLDPLIEEKPKQSSPGPTGV